MRNYFALFFCLIVLNGQAQSPLITKESGTLKSKNDSILLLLQSLDTTSPKHIDLPRIDLDDSDTLMFTKTNNVYDVNLIRGKVQITTDEQGRIVNTKYNLKKSTETKKNPRVFWDSYADLGYNRVIDSDNLFPDLNHTKSVSFAFYPCLIGYKLIDNHFAIMTGIGMEWFNFRFTQNKTLKEIDGITRAVPVSAVFEGVNTVFKSKLTASYLNLPVYLKLILPTRKNQLYIVGGAILSANLGHHTKIKYEDDGSHKKKNYDDLNLSPFRFGLTAKAGYGIVGFFASYYTTPLFQDGKGPLVYPYTIGLTFSIF